MKKPRIIIVDTDFNYVIPLQQKFIEEFFDQIDLEIITDTDYLETLFRTPQTVDILIISEELYNHSVLRHNISHTFIMSENVDEEQTVDLSLNRLRKYTSVKDIFNEIVAKSSDSLNLQSVSKQEPKIVLVYSACGGCGKTTLALGMCMCLHKNFKKVLYINASRINTFQHLLANPSPISGNDVYVSLSSPHRTIYQEIKHVIRKEEFQYLPPFKAPLMALDIPYSVYENIAVSAKKSQEFDFIIIDADTVYDEDKTRLMNVADRVMIVTDQTEHAVFSTNILVSNINGINGEKYTFVCNKFDSKRDNALISPMMDIKFSINEYVNYIDRYDQLDLQDLATDSGIQKMAFLVV